MRKNKPLDSCLNGKGDLFNEIKKMRKIKTPVASSSAGVLAINYLVRKGQVFHNKLDKNYCYFFFLNL